MTHPNEYAMDPNAKVRIETANELTKIVNEQARTIAALEKQVGELKEALRLRVTQDDDDYYDSLIDAGMSYPLRECDCDFCKSDRILIAEAK